MAGRPPLPLGTWGAVQFEGAPGAWVARTRFRDLDGVTRQVKRNGATKGAARDALTNALTERATPSGDDLTGDSRLDLAVTLWIADRERAGLADNTMRRYREVARDHVTPALGALRLRECRTQRLDTYLQTVAEKTGAATARLCRTVLSGALGLAVRYDAIDSNPMRDTAGITVAPKDPRALSSDEVRAVRDAVIAWQLNRGGRGRPRQAPVLDVLDLLLATGARISEVLALRWCDVDLEAWTVTIAGTLAYTDTEPPRVFRQDHPKSASGLRQLCLPAHGVAVLTRRRVTAVGNALDLVFPSAAGTFIDPKNWRTRLREALKPAGLQWVTPHSLRRTVATALDRAESTRTAADQLGHAGEEVTRRHYVAKAHVGPDVREHLDSFFA